MPNLFSYGTLQKEKVQIETFGRILTGRKDILPGYVLSTLEITDPDVLRKSEQQYHPVIEFTGNRNDIVEGVLFEVTEQELEYADKYEVQDYQRVFVELKSGQKGYVYVRK